LAEGADRLVARELLERGASLVVVLPLDRDDYRRDFATEASLAEFDHLLAAADDVRSVPAFDSREAAYEAAGLTVLEASDVLIAVWDGRSSRGRGGTAEIVEAANARGTNVLVVPVTRDNV